MSEFTDPAGDRVLAFTSKIRNLGRVAELTDAVIDIATSGVWRDYHVATGHETWREAELDYFLIACEMHYADVARVLSWNAQAKELAPLMDKGANSDRRRSLDEVAWQSPAGESLADRARRLGWVGETGVIHSPIPQRARAIAKHGVTLDEHAREGRKQRIPAARRRELDRLAKSVLSEVADANERRYLVDRLARNGVGRPAASNVELERWRADAERLGWSAYAELAAAWGITRDAAYRRVKRLLESQKRKPS
jgi:hypothetical protein